VRAWQCEWTERAIGTPELKERAAMCDAGEMIDARNGDGSKPAALTADERGVLALSAAGLGVPAIVELLDQPPEAIRRACLGDAEARRALEA
jgi:hypothetical protein